MLESGLIVMTAFISPFRKDRNDARKLITSNDFIEIYCKASLEKCESRDVRVYIREQGLERLKTIRE